MIILVSNIETVIDEIKYLLKKRINKILFIPSSLSNKEKTNKYKNKILEIMNFNNSLDLQVDIWDYDVNKTFNFNDYHLIFLMGGDVREQNKLIMESDISLKDFKGTIIGQSAGAFNLCKDIYLTKTHKESDTTLHMKGIGLVDVIIDVHFDKEKAYNIQDLKDINKEVYCITDKGALVVNNGFIQIKGDVFLLNNGILEKVGK